MAFADGGGHNILSFRLSGFHSMQTSVRITPVASCTASMSVRKLCDGVETSWENTLSLVQEEQHTASVCPPSLDLCSPKTTVVM